MGGCLVMSTASRRARTGRAERCWSGSTPAVLIVGDDNGRARLVTRSFWTGSDRTGQVAGQGEVVGVRLEVKFWIDVEDHDVVYDGVASIGGYDVEIEEREDAPPARTGRSRREVKS